MVAGVSVMWLLFFRINTVEQKSEESVWASKGTGNALILYQKSRFSLTQDTVICMAEGLQKEGYSVVANHPRHDVPYEIQDFDLVVLCSPVYGGTVVVIIGKDPSTDAQIGMVMEEVKGTDDIHGIKQIGLMMTLPDSFCP